MKIKKARFITSITGDADFPGRGLPQVAIMGKSNVGKSSLINSLANQNKLAKTSQQPGKTRLINIFLFNENFHLVDLPGYGYAKVSKHIQEDWERMMGEYLESSQFLKQILLLVDIRHAPDSNDKSMLAWVKETGIPFVVVATKADKLSKSQQIKSVRALSESLGVDREDIFPTSSVNKQGKDELVNRIGEVLFV